jgi:hypothetical protein
MGHLASYRLSCLTGAVFNGIAPSTEPVTSTFLRATAPVRPITGPVHLRARSRNATNGGHSTYLRDMAHFVAIGRVSRPFPRPKRSMRLSPHCAFQFDPRTREEQTHGCPWGGAPVGPAYRHLLSSLRLFVPLFKDVPWRTFTVSAPLQHGVWLRRRLRPPVRTLAFSCPAEAGDAAWEFPSSRAICDRVP